MHGFAHLHVASGFSMRYGASMPEDLVERAAEHGQGALALTDRDGLYGAVRFATACGRAGIAPVLGVDLAVEPLVPGAVGGGTAGGTASGPDAGRPRPRPRTPVRGGAIVDPRRPRVTVLARGRGGGTAPGVGWAALCRLVTETHLRGERGVPVTSPDLLATWSHPTPRLRPRATCARFSHPPGRRNRRQVARSRRSGGAGGAEPAARAARPRLRRRPGGARRAPRAGPRPPRAPGRRCCPATGWPSRSSTTAAPRAPPAAARTPPTCSAWPTPPACPPCSPRRCATPTPARCAPSTCSTPPAGSSCSTRATSTGSPTPATSPSTAAMHATALEVTGGDRSRADRLVAMTCPGRRRVHPAGPPRPRHRRGAPARGRGARHRPRHRPDAGARPALPRRRRPALPRRQRGRAAGRARPARRRARRHRHPGLPHLLPHRRRGHRPDPGPRGAGRRPRLGGGQPGQPPARHQRGRPDPAPPAHGAVLLTAARRAARHRRRRRVGPPHRDLRGGARPASAASGSPACR